MWALLTSCLAARRWKWSKETLIPTKMSDKWELWLGGPYDGFRTAYLAIWCNWIVAGLQDSSISIWCLRKSSSLIQWLLERFLMSSSEQCPQSGWPQMTEHHNNQNIRLTVCTTEPSLQNTWELSRDDSTSISQPAELLLSDRYSAIFLSAGKDSRKSALTDESRFTLVHKDGSSSNTRTIYQCLC